MSSETAKETKAKRTLTPPAQFQKLYEVLDSQEEIKHLGLFDEQFWNEIKKGDILEVEANMRTSSLFLQIEQIQGFSSLASLVQKFGTVMSDSDLNLLSGIGDLGRIIQSKAIPLIFQVESISKYHFPVELNRDFIAGNASDFQGEAYVFGKVQKILKKGEKIDVFSLIPDLESLQLNRQQRLALKSNKNKSKMKMSESVSGPAIVINPLAVYR
ncbi:MAG: hypothetical protein FJZ86_14025 [Chloroflexi bacterium]|nr:hypothetical protein [Chloroflexota bacterium]